MLNLISCEFWAGIDINVRKTKVMIFSRGKIRKMPKFNFNEETVDVVWDYKYLGVKFNYNNEFKKAQQLQFPLAYSAVFIVKKMSAAKVATRYTVRTFWKMCVPNPFVWLWNMGVRQDGCNLKTAASIFKTDLRCQSYNYPNVYGAWGSGKISNKNWSKMQDVRILVWFVLYLSLWIAQDF